MGSTVDLTGKTALVTGAARGFGATIATALAGAGASVLLTDVLDDLGRETAEAVGAVAAERGARAVFQHLDVTDDAGWEAATSAAVQQLGGLDVVVNNAGVEITRLVVDADPAELETMFRVNVIGTTLGTKHAFRTMRPGGAAGSGGAVVNISSVAATIAFPGIAGYSASKSAVDRLTRVAAAESGRLGYGVRVNCVYPGLVPTEMGVKLAVETSALGLFESPDAAVAAVVGLTPLGRLGEPADIADVVLFLASDASRFMTGAGVPVDGGMGMQADRSALAAPAPGTYPGATPAR